MKKQTPFGQIEISDAHCHFFSRGFFEALIGQSPALREDPDPIARAGELTGWVMPPADPVQLAADWEGELNRHGVRRAMFMASVPEDEGAIAAARAAYPGRIVGAFFLDPTGPDAEDRARRAFDELGLKVACFFPAMHHYSFAEHEGVKAIVSLAARRPGTAIFVHCGALSVGARKKLGLRSLFDLRRSNPLDLYRVVAEFPTVPFIVPHFGAGMFREALMLADLCPNIFFDTSSSNQWMKYEPGPIDLKTVFERALAVAGHERLLFGTDSSFFPRGWHEAILERQLQVLVELACDEGQARAILGGNLCRILNLS